MADYCDHDDEPKGREIHDQVRTSYCGFILQFIRFVTLFTVVFFPSDCEL